MRRGYQRGDPLRYLSFHPELPAKGLLLLISESPLVVDAYSIHYQMISISYKERQRSNILFR
jgi:hypothetical protein